MNPIPELITLLKQLRLSGILDSLEARNREAVDGQLAYTDFLGLLGDLQQITYHQKATIGLISMSHFGSFGLRSKRSSIARIADFVSEMPFS